MKTAIIFFFLCAVISSTYSQDIQHQVRGVVTDFNKNPLSQVNIIIKHTNKGTSTDRFGRYELIASSGDTLLFTYLGMQPYQIEVTEVPAVINLSMQSSSIQLEAIIIEASRLRSQAQQLLKEYPTNKNLIKTSWGIIDKDKISGTMRIIDGNKMINSGPDFLTSLNNYVPNMQVTRGWDGVRVSLSRRGVIFEVDGMIHKSPPTFLQSSDIDRVAVLERSLAVTTRYGSEGAGGLIIINTKGQTEIDELGVDRSFENKILLDSMTIEASGYDDYVPFTSIYLDPLKRFRKKKKAYAIHEIQKQNHFDNPYYYLEIYDYLLSRWKNSSEATRLFKEIANRFQNNAEALKALAFLQEKHGNYKNALSLYLKIQTLNPNKAQSHRDVANAFIELGDYKNALIRYNWFVNSTDYRTNDTFDTRGEDLLMTTEILNILQRYGNELVDSFDVKNVTEIYTGTRLVFDWNNPKAKFDLQFITPDRYYDTWQNYIENVAQKDSLSEPRYYSKQFFIDKVIKGKWTINMNYHGNQSDSPTYLKLSIYRDYGLPSQSLKIRVYRLSEQHKKIKLFQFGND